MSRAILYVRVSTDEQAEKGYSQRDQEERLRNWCKYNSVGLTQNKYGSKRSEKD
jgi:site-specific DNA recombinase